MTGMGPYVRIQLDESFLDKAFKQIEIRLDKHEEMILELQKLLRDKADKTEVQDMRDSLSKEMDAKVNELNSRISALEAKFDLRIREVEENFENRLMDTANMLNLTMRQRFDDIESRMPNSTSQVSEFNDRLQTIEETVYANGKKLHLTRESVQHIASAVALFNSTTAALDNTLPDVLKKSVTSVTKNIEKLYDEIDKLRDKLQAQSIIQNKPVAPVVIQHETSVIHAAGESKQPDFDLSSIRPYPSMVAHWRDPPELPPIHPFLNMGEVVDYIYRLVPKLQAHLTAMQAKIVENAADIVGKVDKSLVEKMFEKFQSVIGEMAGRVDELREAVEETATRDEINEMVEDLFNSMNQEGQTAVGRVRCMACGREIPQVTGAITEDEAQRSLGPAPNSVAFKARGAPPLGVVYQTKDGFDSTIVESPRSIRPFKPSRIGVSKTQKMRSPR